ncbi:hypothetical protein [uncultured Shewanella sp.]|uniref:hypothetical protein n=1 Tax=uncultured Shewanella sp. TaxID=173975 RepID=UPI00262EDC90|nr:hypothetical protein [uncultured Shewanella sp.]
MIMDMPQNIESLDADVFQALQQQTEIVSVISVTQVLTSADLLMRLQTPVQMKRGQSDYRPDFQQTVLLSDSWVPPTPMWGGGGDQPVRKFSAFLVAS